MALHHVLEALARIEHKLDIIIRGVLKGPHTPMHFVGASCPVCSSPIDYVIDITHGVVTRKCECRTGKVPTAPLLPVSQPGESNGRANRRDRAEAGASEPEDRPDRKER